MIAASYRAGIIGHTGRGDYGHGLDVAFRDVPGVAVVAVADPDAGGRARALTSSGAARAYADYHDMLARESPDVVAVAPRWLDQRVPMVTAAVEAGVKAIYCEKPFARSLDEADRMLALCDAAGVKVAVAHQNRARAAPRLAKQLVAEGKIGRLRVIRAYSKHDERGGGQELLVHGTHLFDLMRFIAGDAYWCHARVTAAGHDATAADVEPAEEEAGWIAGDDVLTTYGFDSGVTGVFESIRADDGGGTPYYHMELYGTGGILAFWSDHRSPVCHYPQPFVVPPASRAATPHGGWNLLETDAPPLLPGVAQQHPGNQTLVRDLLAAVAEDCQPISSGDDARAALEMILAAYESHRRGARVSLPLAERSHPLAGW